MSIKRSFLGVPIYLGSLLLALFLFAGTYSHAAHPDVPDSEDAIKAGEAIFNANCKTCHKLDQRYTGPALRGVTERRTLDWAKNFIVNSQALIQSGDAQAVALFREYNNIVMPAHDFLSDMEVMNLLSYIEYGGKEDASAQAAAGADGAAGASGGIPSEYLSIIVGVLILVLVLILVVLALIVSVLTKYLNTSEKVSEEDKAFINQKGDIKKVLTSDGVIVIVTTIVMALVVKTAIDGLYGIGIQQGYAPTQPIAYSHELHAGKYEIPCQYCHTGVEIGKSANIPSANICMNCHMHIQNVDGKEGVSPEIAKLYDAYDNNRPIEWVRIHNLPDLAYFNHAQHVKVGGIECQTCHGPIEEMEVVYQHSALTMGWCIDCHRNTEVNAQGNQYYDKLVQLHADSKDALKVKDIGGLECAKCHY
ncbi:Molybdopterin oxidoreductase subunit, predicted [Lunatimonas lonarensis]|uniref:Molybdopterin oxidoreductase subunit, predicted n=1 Tax=Lunatimonas lonarensis TaxID=1232681 RepID=R7ZLT4_9BACT|nr:c-type cytochrome [Lunatimonas lonarensis]EON75048.1 Molybdopterin oxidoreductase subunit, predicted [Lunatimonas lonarensis]